jgi:hypothetical protein
MAEEPTGGINFAGDQDDFEERPEEMKEHMMSAFVHNAGLGPHPGKYKGPKHEPTHPKHREGPSESLLQRLREEEYPEMMGMEQGQAKPPTPPEEALPPQPPIGGKGGKPGSKPPSQGTPTAIGHAAVAQPPPAGEF